MVLFRSLIDWLRRHGWITKTYSGNREAEEGRIVSETSHTICASCRKPIFPGMPVALAWDGARYPYTHVNSPCCEVYGLTYCGTWGKGRLIPLCAEDIQGFKL